MIVKNHTQSETTIKPKELVIVDSSNHDETVQEEILILSNFLNEYDLDYELDIDYSILVYYQEKLIATASLSNNVMKCFLVATDFIGQNVTGLMFSHLVNVLMQKGINHYIPF